jgi:threonine dehydrogenase-like Zn-dependent dehydrogenase
MGAHAAYPDAGELDDNEGFDIAVDASGHPKAIQSAVDMLGPRGRLVQMGVAHEDARISVSPYAMFAKELSIIGSNSLANAYAAAIDLMPDIADALRPLVTDRLPLTRYAEAVRRASSPHSIKVQVVPG